MVDANVKIRGGDGNAITLQSRDIDAAAPADTNVLAWSSSDSEWEPTAAASGGGKILQVLSTEKTDVFSTDSQTWTDITGLTVTITPAAATSKIMVMYSFGSSSLKNGYGPAYRLVRDSTPIHLGAQVGSLRLQASGGSYSQTTGVVNDKEQIFTISSHFLDSPSTTSATVYKMQANSLWAEMIYVGQSQNDTDADKFFRIPSTISVMEVGA